VEAYASLTGLPTSLLDPTADFDVAEIRDFFEHRIFAQPEAVTAVVDLVTCIRAGLNSPDRPLGSFLFLGPTGVGKTQTALTLSEYLFGSPDRLVRFDMSEYQDAWAAGRLVGRYRGERGELVRRVREQPFLVLLLDEIEKAHANVFDFLLQVLGEGRLTDGLGRTVSLTSAVVIMTSNLGAGGPPSVGFSARDGAAERDAEVAHYTGAVEAFFRPEFVGRIDQVIPFRSLGAKTARKLVERALEQAFAREGLTRRNVRARATDAVVEFLIGAGLDTRYGARPLRRAVENYITAPLAKFLSRESGIEGIDVIIDMVDGLPRVDVE
jgi:ATP-dependent Clp protease ATP-binding subunit ClpC